MRYLIDLTQRQIAYISKFLSKKKYVDIQQFVSAAIDNQIYIEGQDISQQPIQSHSNRATTNNTVIIKEQEHDSLGHPVIDVEIKPHLTEIKNKPKPLPMPKFEELAYSIKRDKPLEEKYAWLWGQVNRIFPIKLGLRVLLVMLGNEEVIELESFRTKAGTVALAYGKMLRSRERYAKKMRDKRVSAGLPIDVTDNEFRESVMMKLRKNRRQDEIDQYLQQEEFKSTNRYRSQFLAFVRKDARFEGAMSCLKFINLRKKENGTIYIGLTKPGLEFAKLMNPVIDDKKIEQGLSVKESDFYLNHVAKNVKSENLAIRWLLEKIDSGISEREKINDELKKEFNSVWKDSNDVINTQRAGLMARMFELGLLDKEKIGIAVKYKISEKGKKILRRE